jgi:hypothetical protein
MSLPPSGLHIKRQAFTLRLFLPIQGCGSARLWSPKSNRPLAARRICRKKTAWPDHAYFSGWDSLSRIAPWSESAVVTGFFFGTYRSKQGGLVAAGSKRWFVRNSFLLVSMFSIAFDGGESSNSEGIVWRIDRAYQSGGTLEDTYFPGWDFEDMSAWTGALLGDGGVAWGKLFDAPNTSYGVHNGKCFTLDLQ